MNNGECINESYSKWEKDMEEIQKPFNFIKIDFLIDVREAERRYHEEYKNDVDRIRTSGITFNQWLDGKKFQATDFYLKNSNYYLGF